MGGTLLRTALRRSLTRVHHVHPVRPASATGLVARVYRQVERDFGMLAPPVALHSPAPGPLAASWMMLRETLVADGAVDRATKEAVATAVSLGNTCPYCVTVHSTALSGLTHGLVTVAEERVESVGDAGVLAVAAWARSGGTSESAVARPVPFPVEHAPELVGVAATFHYLNRMVNVFLDDSPLPSGLPVAARGGVLRVMGRFMGAHAGATHPPGAALDLLPAASVPEDLSWTEGAPHVSGAFARAAAAIGAAGDRSVPVAVRDLVSAQVAGWNGHPRGPSRAWAEEATGELPDRQRPAGRLALLTALASYQVDRAVVEAFRRVEPDDQVLVELTSWASMVAARRVAGWMRTDRHPPVHPAPGIRQHHRRSDR